MSDSTYYQEGLTLTEILIMFTIVALFLITAYFVFFKQIFKALDGKRKADLHTLTNILEDFYNDTGCYPRPTEICYDAADDTTIPCHICGDEANPLPGFDLPCNPEHPKKKYLYDVENSDCPQWYRIYTELDNPESSGPCPYGSCGPDGEVGYDYGISSPNVNLERSSTLWGYEGGSYNACQECGTVEMCEQGNYEGIYSGMYDCCMDNPEAMGCVFYGCDPDSHTCNYCGNLRQCTDAGYEKIYGSQGACYDDVNDCP